MTTRWNRMGAAYWPPTPAIDGPEVLLAWQEEDVWQYGVGWGSWPLRGQTNDEGPLFWVNEYVVTPAFYAYIDAPEDQP